LIEVKAEDQDNIEIVENKTYHRLIQLTGGYLYWSIILTLIMSKEQLFLVNADFWAHFS
jgi:hypothetical protein